MTITPAAKAIARWSPGPIARASGLDVERPAWFPPASATRFRSFPERIWHWRVSSYDAPANARRIVTDIANPKKIGAN